MPFLKITNGFKELPDAKLLTRGTNITGAITGNVYFPGPVPSLAATITALDTFSDALNAAASGDRVLIGVKNTKRDELIEALHVLASYVLLTANGNIDIARSSLFTISKAHEPQPPLQKPTNLKVTNGVNKGELRVSIKRVAGARSYMYQYTKGPITENSVWITVTATTSKVLLRNLQSREEYWCRVIAVGTNGQEVYSDTLSSVVL